MTGLPLGAAVAGRRPRRELPPRPSFSEVLGQLAAHPSDRIAISDVLTAFGDRAFGALMLFFAAPNALPMPPGVSAIFGA